MFRVVWLPVNQAWLVLYGETYLAGPYNTRREAEDYLRGVGVEEGQA